MQRRFVLLGVLYSVLCLTSGHRFPRHFHYAAGQAGLPNIPVHSPLAQFASTPNLNSAALQPSTHLAAGAGKVEHSSPLFQTAPHLPITIPKSQVDLPSKTHHYPQQPLHSLRQAVPLVQAPATPVAQQQHVVQQQPSNHRYPAAFQQLPQQPVAPAKSAGAYVTQQQSNSQHPTFGQQLPSFQSQQSFVPANPPINQVALQRYPAPTQHSQQQLSVQQQHPPTSFVSQQLQPQFQQPAAVEEQQHQQSNLQSEHSQLTEFGAQQLELEPQPQEPIAAEPQPQLAAPQAAQPPPQFQQHDAVAAEPKQQQQDALQPQQQGPYFDPHGQDAALPEPASPQPGLGFSPLSQVSPNLFRPSQQVSLNLNQDSFLQGHFYPFPVSAQIDSQHFGATGNAVPPAEVEQQDLQVTEHLQEIPQVLEDQPFQNFIGVDSSTPTLDQVEPVTQRIIDLPEEKSPVHFETLQGVKTEDPQGELHLNPDENSASALLVSVPEAGALPVPQEDPSQDTDLLTQAKLHDLGSFPVDFNLPLAEDNPTQAPFIEQPQTEAPANVPEPKTDTPISIEPFPIVQEQPNSQQNIIPDHVNTPLTEAPQQVEISNQPPMATNPASSQGPSSFSFSYFNEPMSVDSLDWHVRANAARIVSQKFHEYMTDTTGFPGSVSYQKQAKRPSSGYGLPLAQPITWEG